MADRKICGLHHNSVTTSFLSCEKVLINLIITSDSAFTLRYRIGDYGKSQRFRILISSLETLLSAIRLLTCKDQGKVCNGYKTHCNFFLLPKKFLVFSRDFEFNGVRIIASRTVVKNSGMKDFNTNAH